MTSYRNPQALKAALEDHQKRRAREQGVLVDRVQHLDLCFRFLDRALQELDGALVLKGGTALEMRLQRARTTRDVDLRAVGDPGHVFSKLRAAGQRDHGDYLTFDLADEGPVGAAVYQGQRFKVQARFTGKPYRQPFGLDVVVGDPMVGVPDLIQAPDALGFAGIPAPTIPVYPIGTHLAEKLHAYTLPQRTRSRMKDLVDMALVAAESLLQPAPVVLRADELRTALRTTFDFRGTHDLPATMPPPPDDWRPRYERERGREGLGWRSIQDVRDAAAAFMEPVLAGGGGTWDPRGTWTGSMAWAAP